MNLYQISKELEALIDDETGEISDFDALESLAMEKDQKIDAIICLIKNHRADASACTAESKAFADRAKRHENEAKRLQNYLGGFLDYTKTTTPHGSVSFRKNYAVEADMSLVPVDYITAHTEYAADKKAIMAALKAGESIPGCSLKESYSMSLK